MKLTIHILSQLVLFSSLIAQTIDFERTYGGDENDYCNALIRTLDGGYALAGQTGSFAEGEGDMWLLISDENGDSLWSVTAGGDDVSSCNDIIQLDDGCFILVGWVITPHDDDYQGRVVKIDEDANIVWDYVYGGDNEDRLNAITQIDDGGFILCGQTYSFGVGGSDAWLLKIDKDGEEVWNRTYGGRYDDAFLRVIQTEEGNLASVGFKSDGDHFLYDKDLYFALTDEEGDIITEARYLSEYGAQGNDIIQLDNGEFIIGGYFISDYHDDWDHDRDKDCWILNVNARGNIAFNRKYGGNGHDEVMKITNTIDGNYAFIGKSRSYNGRGDNILFIIIDEEGNLLRRRVYRGLGKARGKDILQVDDNGFALVGSMDPAGDRRSLFWLLKLSEINFREPLTQIVPDDFDCIQDAIDASDEGDTVLVRPGTYEENFQFENYGVVVGSYFLQTGDTSYIASTILDGGGDGSVVCFRSGNCDESLLSGFTITNGVAVNGGGINMERCGATLSNLIICDNTASRRGGGIYCNLAEPRIERVNVIRNHSMYEGGGIWTHLFFGVINDLLLSENAADTAGGGFWGSVNRLENAIISKNSSIFGGGMYIPGSWNIINNVVITNNESVRGAGIYLWSGRNYLSNTRVVNNVALYNGGGLYCNHSTLIADNSAIIQNEASVGGAIFLDFCYPSCAQITNLTIADNLAHSDGGGIVCYSRSEAHLVNSILWNNQPDEAVLLESHSNLLEFDHCDIEDGEERIEINDAGEVIWREGNIDADPLFIDPDSYDYHLSEDSPCIDAGVYVGYEYVGEAPDIGAYEYGLEWIDPGQIESPVKFILYSNYPNPFNSQTVIRYKLPYSTPVTLKVYDLLGRSLLKLYEGYETSGLHTRVLNGNDLPSGIYFINLQSAERQCVQRFIIQK